jgi:hypothetical protein
MEAAVLAVDLGPGEGFFLDNRYWMHGRTAFEGPREMLRLLGTFSAGSSDSPFIGCLTQFVCSAVQTQAVLVFSVTPRPTNRSPRRSGDT